MRAVVRIHGDIWHTFLVSDNYLSSFRDSSLLSNHARSMIPSPLHIRLYSYLTCMGRIRTTLSQGGRVGKTTTNAAVDYAVKTLARVSAQTPGLLRILIFANLLVRILVCLPVIIMRTLYTTVSVSSMGERAQPTSTGQTET